LKLYHGSKKFSPKPRPVVALGNFDGVHVAHRTMFSLARKMAKRMLGASVAYTFYPHPVKVLSPASAPKMINTLAQRLELIDAEGIHATVVEPFSLKFAHLSAEKWFRKVIVKNLKAQAVVAGYDFTFGSHRSGTVESLEKLCKENGIVCKILEAQIAGETLISSTQIRHFVAGGEMKRAAKLLGRPYFIDGHVIAGAGRGAQLGIRTANLQSENELIPQGGVYATQTRVGNRYYPSVTNIGINPTFGGKALSIETHLLDFKGDLYGKTLRIAFLQKIRDERTFASVTELVAQIHRDIARARLVK